MDGTYLYGSSNFISKLREVFVPVGGVVLEGIKVSSFIILVSEVGADSFIITGV